MGSLRNRLGKFNRNFFAAAAVAAFSIAADRLRILKVEPGSTLSSFSVPRFVLISVKSR